jgi:large-conductance mechanosensitive channel
MKGFKDFVMRGSLVELAVAFIMAAAFAAVVTTFTNWLLSLIPAGATNFGDTKFGRSLSSTSPGPWRRRPFERAEAAPRRVTSRPG